MGDGGGLLTPPQPHPVVYTGETDPIPIVQKAGWAPGSVLMVRKVSPPPEFDPWTAPST